MFRYFGYGSNMNLTSLLAKGVRPASSERARLRGYRLRFNVHHWFRHEGGVGNIVPSDEPDATVEGVVHTCAEEDLPRLDAVESFGVGYDRIQVSLETEREKALALTYVGLPSYLDDRCLPTQRYLNILLRGAESAGLDPAYIEKIRQHPVHQPARYGPFVPPSGPVPIFDRRSLAEHPDYTAIAGAVFDMRGARWQHACLKELFGGKDMTLFHIRRLDSSTGHETLEDLEHGRLSVAQSEYLNAYLHEYASEYRYVGRYSFQELSPELTERSNR